jgi:uncharacterized membrane protein YdbT with pleckstrin-like domain
MDENTIWTEKPSLLKSWPKFFIGIVLLISWVFLPERILLGEINIKNIVSIPYIWIISAIIALIILYLLIEIIKIISLKYEITNERLFIFSGVFSRMREEIELYRIKDYEVFQPFYIRLFGLSNILIHTSDRTSPVIMLMAINKGYKIADLIRENVEKQRRQKGVREID